MLARFKRTVAATLAVLCALAMLCALAAAAASTTKVSLTVGVDGHVYRGNATLLNSGAPSTRHKGTSKKGSSISLLIKGAIPFKPNQTGPATVSYHFMQHGKKIAVRLAGADLFSINSSGFGTIGRETLSITYTGYTVQG